MQQLRTHSGTAYLGILSSAVILTQYASYLGKGEPVFKGQSAAIVLFFILFGVAFLFWFNVESRARARGALSGFLIVMSLAWFAQLYLYRLHGDAFNYIALLFVPILAMIWLKPPELNEVLNAILAYAWTVAVVLALTRILEMIGALAIKAQPQNVITFDEERYFLPLNDILGIEGRWPGPFGHNGDTAMMGALLIVIAFAFWTRSSWVFITVGGFTLIVTNGRASIGAAIAGLIVLVVFAKKGRIALIPRTLRLGGGIAALVLGAILMFFMSAGSTGRNIFWPAFLELWQSSPLVGIGSSGISMSGGVTAQYGHAHNMYIDELARHGLLGFLTQYGAIALGIVIAFFAARRGFAGPLAIITTYLVTGVTEPRYGWMGMSPTSMAVILGVVTACVALRQDSDPKLIQVPRGNT